MVALIAVLSPAAAPASANAASPVLEFITPAAFPIGFTAEGGAVSAALAEFDTEVHCSGSSGNGEITGPRSTLSSYVFTGCVTQGGSKGGAKCHSEGAGEEEISSGTIEADLVYIDQAQHQVGVVLNPHGGTYLSFKCGGEAVKAIGSFLSPVGPVNTQATSFTAILTRSGALQTPSSYETVNGERLQAIPTGEREGVPAATTGVELGFTIHTGAPLEIRAISAAEIEAKQREEEAAAKKRQEEREREEGEAARRRRAQLLAKALRRCRKFHSRHRRIRCETHAKRKYRGYNGKREK